MPIIRLATEPDGALTPIVRSRLPSVATRQDACETGGVTNVPLETWVSIGSLLGVGLSIVLVMRVMFKDLGGRIDRVEMRLNARIDDVKAELSSRIDAVESNLTARINAVESSLTARIDGVESSLTARIDGVESSLTARIDGVESSLTARIDGVESSLTARIDGLSTRVDKLDDRVYALAVGMKPLLERAGKAASRTTAPRTA
jgi:outer membrane murein-binding lipoprotein Lpp